MTTEPLVLVNQDGAVRTLTLNRPAALNSFTAALHRQLREALEAAAQDPGVRCVVLTGAGRGFCAGQDLHDPDMAPGPEGTVDIGAVIEAHYKPLALLLRRMPVPVLARVQGVAAGAGANLALGCDMVVAGRSASFIQAFSKIGLIPDCGGTWLLPRLAGRAVALGLALTGERLPAEEAERLGLIWRCVDDAQLDEAVTALAHRLAAMSTRALAVTRQCLDQAVQLDMAAALDQEAHWQRELGRAHDFREGVEAFTAKRAPVFRDR
nr:enoyl-CoA hydratase-related protein [Ideonella livida]